MRTAEEWRTALAEYGSVGTAEVPIEHTSRPADLVCVDCGCTMRPHSATRLSVGSGWRCRACFANYVEYQTRREYESKADAQRKWRASVAERRGYANG